MCIRDSIDTINGRIAEVPDQIDQYIAIVNQINGLMKDVRTSVVQQQARVKLILTFVLVWWGLPQLALVMMGWDFFLGRRGLSAAKLRQGIIEDLKDDIEEMVEEEKGK
jgi:hypothetical protein